MKHVLTMLLWSSLLLGCSSDEGSQGAGKPLLSIRSAQVGNSGQADTRATPSYSELTSGSIGLYLRADADKYAPKDNVKFTYEASGNPWTPETPIWLGSESAKICAYYPYHSSAAGYGDPAVLPLATRLYSASEDLSYSTNVEVDGSVANSTVILKLKRAYSQLALNFKRHATELYPGTCRITQIELTNSTLINKATLKIDVDSESADGTLTAATDGTTGIFSYDLANDGLDITVPPAPTDGSTNVGVPSDNDPTITTNVNRSILLIPFALTESLADDGSTLGLIIKLTVDGKPMTVNILHTDLPQFLAGMRYVVTVSIRGTATKVEGIRAEDWKNVPVGGADGEYVPL